MSNPENKSGFYLSGLGALGTIFSASLAMGCCAGLFAPAASVAATTLPFLDSSFQMPLLYTAVVVTLSGLVISYRRGAECSTRRLLDALNKGDAFVAIRKARLTLQDMT